MSPRRYPVASGFQVVKALECLGFTRARTTGSHAIMVRSARTVPVPEHREDLRLGTLKSIGDLAGITPEDLKQAL
jgi:predicted RNA binding protein YcfA (HicA-like mRNA interferase family)